MRDRLQQDLKAALSRRDRAETSVLRSLIAALGNAEAVAPSAGDGSGSATVAGSSLGVGSSDVARRPLTDADVAAVMSVELDEREQAAQTYERAGRIEQATALRAEAAVVRRYLS